jgi:hypothetical protein
MNATLFLSSCRISICQVYQDDPEISAMASLRTAYEHDAQASFTATSMILSWLTDSLCLLQGKMTLVPLTSCWPTRPTGSCLMLSFAPTCRHSFLIQQIFYWIDWFEIGKICSGQTGFAAKYTVAGQTCQVMLLSHHAVLRCLHISNRGSCITSNHYNCLDVVDRCFRTWSNHTVALAWTS